MLKRELGLSSANVDVDSPRAKRKRDAPGSSLAAIGAAHHGVEDVHMADVSAPGGEDGMTNVEEVKEQGLQVWHILKSAINKEGRVLSTDFLKLPSKRQYPDYYLQIKRPIALDDIKASLERGAYKSIESVRDDLITCFKNAKKYNMRESQIWKDAKALQKITNAEFEKYIPEDDNDGEDGESDEDRKKKKKAPNLTRLIKSRLQKLVAKTADDGRVLSDVFMDLPSKKQWPIYYKTIKKPICIEDIFKRIKRKEYETIAEFVADVDLVFNNALQFNQDHTPIWEDATTLKDHFHQLMLDLPPPFGDSKAETTALPPTTKIMLKLPIAASASVPLTSLNNNANGATSATTDSSHKPSPVVLRVPAVTTNTASANGTVAAVKPTPAPPTATPATAPATSTFTVATPKPKATAPPKPAPTPAQANVQSRVQPPTKQPTPTPATTTTPAAYPFAANHYTPHVFYQSPAQQVAQANAVATNTATPARATPATTSASHSHTSTPAPSVTNPNSRPIQSVRLQTQPLGRAIMLDSREGVKNWVIRLGMNEERVVVSDIHFFLEATGAGGGGGGGGEAGSEDEEEEEEEEESSEDEADVGKRAGAGGSPRKGKGKAFNAKTSPGSKQAQATRMQRPRRAKGNAVLTTTAKAIPPPPASGDIFVKLDGQPLKGNSKDPEEWTVEVPLGSHTVDVGEKGGYSWKAYLVRRG